MASFAVEDAPALHLGRVRRQHRADRAPARGRSRRRRVRTPRRLASGASASARRPSAGGTPARRAWRKTRFCVRSSAMFARCREVAERADDRDRRLDVEGVQLSRELRARRRVAVPPELHREAAARPRRAGTARPSRRRAECRRARGPAGACRPGAGRPRRGSPRAAPAARV